VRVCLYLTRDDRQRCLSQVFPPRRRFSIVFPSCPSRKAVASKPRAIRFDARGRRRRGDARDGPAVEGKARRQPTDRGRKFSKGAGENAALPSNLEASGEYEGSIAKRELFTLKAQMSAMLIFRLGLLTVRASIRSSIWPTWGSLRHEDVFHLERRLKEIFPFAVEHFLGRQWRRSGRVAIFSGQRRSQEPEGP